MHISQTSSVISTYSADLMGVCSALYELGGMVVMHDPSGCNSTYTTHDEPRWEYMDSQIFISALSEMEAIMGDDSKFIDDVVTAAKDLKPRFIVIVCTPVPTMTGFDTKAVARLIESETGIPTIGIPTTGMNTYVHGADLALAELAARFVKAPEAKADVLDSSDTIKVNLLGLTPLDFSITGIHSSMVSSLEADGFTVISSWAMGSASDDDILPDIIDSAKADVNLVVSSTGMRAAKLMEEKLGIPYLVATPVGGKLYEHIKHALRAVAKEQKSNNLIFSINKNFAANDAAAKTRVKAIEDSEILILGEAVTALSLATAIELESGQTVRVICTTDEEHQLLREGDVTARFENDIMPHLRGRKNIIADPMFKPICGDANFISLPHEAFSGRIYRNDIPRDINFIKGILSRLI